MRTEKAKWKVNLQEALLALIVERTLYMSVSRQQPMPYQLRLKCVIVKIYKHFHICAVPVKWQSFMTLKDLSIKKKSSEAQQHVIFV